MSLKKCCECNIIYKVEDRYYKRSKYCSTKCRQKAQSRRARDRLGYNSMSQEFKDSRRKENREKYKDIKEGSEKILTCSVDCILDELGDYE